MAGSLIGGLIADGYAPNLLTVADVDGEKRTQLQERFGIRAAASNAEATRHSDILVIAVKPQMVEAVARELASEERDEPKQLVISIAAGIRTNSLAMWLGGKVPVVRAMPNTPALVQSGATVLYANEYVNVLQRETAESILRAVGLTQWVADETLMDAVTALSGSGPAYFFLIMEALEQAAGSLGLPPELARVLTIQTAFGAAKMALENTSGPEELRIQVTSPGGTTERALQVLREGNLCDLFRRALQAAHERSVELSKLLGKDSHA